MSCEKNPYAEKLNEEVTLNISKFTMKYFREQAEITGIPLQTLINSYLTKAAMENHQFPSIRDLIED